MCVCVCVCVYVCLCVCVCVCVVAWMCALSFVYVYIFELRRKHHFMYHGVKSFRNQSKSKKICARECVCVGVYRCVSMFAVSSIN